jgi:hypothetical protein
VQVVHGGGSPEEKLDALIVGSDAMMAAHEAEFRSVLLLSLGPTLATDSGLPRRVQFRESWLTAALATLKEELGNARFRRLVAALGLMCGIESFVVLHDIFQMNPTEATELKRWAARLLLHAVVHEAADDRKTAYRSARSRRSTKTRRSK